MFTPLFRRWLPSQESRHSLFRHPERHIKERLWTELVG